MYPRRSRLRPMRAIFAAALTAALALSLHFAPAARAAGEGVRWDFSGSKTEGWVAGHHLSDFAGGPDGLAFASVGDDPWIEGPAADYPPGQNVRVTIRMKSRAGGAAELFYGPAFVGGKSERFGVNDDGEWHEYRVTLPAPGKGARLRLDPGYKPGAVTIAWIKADALPPTKAPELRAPMFPPAGGAPAPTPERADAPLLLLPVAGSDPADPAHSADSADSVDSGFAVYVAGESMGFLRDLGGAAPPKGVKVKRRVAFEAAEVEKERSGPRSFGAVTISWELEAVEDAELPHVPWIELFAGLGSFGAKKREAILAGVEWLEGDEPSSSEADVRGPHADRRMVEDFRLTFPLMAVSAGGNWVGVFWDRGGAASPIFDAPDRTYKTDSCLMGLWGPPAGEARLEGSLGAHEPVRLKAGEKLSFSATIIGGKGERVLDAVKAYVALRGAPEPTPPFDEARAVGLLAKGWLDSAIHEDGQWRHAATAGTFPVHPAADAPAWMLWLATRAAADSGGRDFALADRLTKAAARGLERIPAGEPYSSAVGHVRSPVPALLFGRVEEHIRARVDQANKSLDKLDDRGVFVYKSAPGAVDYGSTHYADHANGHTAPVVMRALEAAELAGDPALTARALAALDKLDLYDGTVPRGAQTWEMPLHTPDILASAYLAKAYAMGYELTGRAAYLERAREWAWTGVPFVYLSAPEPGPIGLYATTAVLGSTNWQAPFWIGLPVQWCGLVYADALHRLLSAERHAPGGESADPDAEFFSKLARGITATGLAMTYPEDRAGVAGLLPDSFDLKLQGRNASDINPGTVQSRVAELYGDGGFYGVLAVGRPGADGTVGEGPRVLIHAPGEITLESINEKEARVRVKPWAYGWPISRTDAGGSISDNYRILITDSSHISGVTAAPDSETPPPPGVFRRVFLGGGDIRVVWMTQPH